MGTPNTEGAGTIHRLGELAYAQAHIRPADVDVAELHDATAFNELLAYEESGFCERGSGAELQLRRDAGERQVQGAEIGLAEIAGGYVNGDSAWVAVTILGREPTPA